MAQTGSWVVRKLIPACQPAPPGDSSGMDRRRQSKQPSGGKPEQCCTVLSRSKEWGNRRRFAPAHWEDRSGADKLQIELIPRPLCPSDSIPPSGIFMYPVQHDARKRLSRCTYLSPPEKAWNLSALGATRGRRRARQTKDTPQAPTVARPLRSRLFRQPPSFLAPPLAVPCLVLLPYVLCRGRRLLLLSSLPLPPSRKPHAVPDVIALPLEDR